MGKKEKGGGGLGDVSKGEQVNTQETIPLWTLIKKKIKQIYK